VYQDKIIIHSDGGARGNPGPGASAFVVESGGKLVYQHNKFLGNVTNNVAEYGGVIEALKWVNENLSQLKHSLDPIEFYLDSELVARQLRNEYKVKNENLRVLFQEAQSLLKQIPVKILFIAIPRSKNKIADLLVNQKLDENL
jgi:ribonuclease HI